MSFDNTTWAAVAVGTTLTLCSGFSIWARARERRLVSAVSGMHLYVFLFLGIGTLAYVSAPQSTERNGRILAGILTAGLPLTVSYAGALAAMAIAERKILRKTWFWARSDEALFSPRMVVVFMTAAIIGIVGSRTEFAGSGIGTAFPVLQMFWYPVIAATVAVVTIRSRIRVFLFFVAIVVGLGISVMSPWRSALLLTSGAVILGLVMRGKRWIKWAPALIVAVFIFALPFGQVKKERYDEFLEDPTIALRAATEMAAADRLEFLTTFWSIRVNGAREIGFVVDGLESGRTSLTEGRTYIDAVQQLVPRVLWPEKPSFNTQANYYLARDLGLVGPNDDWTSWGINLFAECVLNFGARALYLFIPIVFALLTSLDVMLAWQIQRDAIRWFVSAGLLFVFIGGVSVVSGITYVLWIVLFGFIADAVSRRRRVIDYRLLGSGRGTRLRARRTDELAN